MRRWHHLMLRTTLQRRVSVMAGVFLLISLALTVVLAQSLLGPERDGDQHRAEQRQWEAAGEGLRDLRGDFVELHAVHQQYVLSTDPTQTPRLAREREQLAEQLTQREDQLREEFAVLEPTALTGRLEEALRDVEEWRTVADSQADVKATGDEDGLRRALANAPASREFRTAYLDMESLARELHQERTADAELAEEDLNRFRLVQVLVLGIALLMVPTVLHLVRRWVLRPLDQLSHQMLGVGGGDLQTPVGLAGPPELAAVAHSAETMRRRILDELADAVSAREALAQGQPLVAEVRDQLAAHELPVLAGWSAAAALRPAEGLLAGDWYDVLPLQDGRYAVVVADVSGHGARAGIVAIQLKRLLEAALHLAPEPDLALAMAARVFTDEAERFASCVVAVVDPDSGLVRYANAGHPAPLVLRSDGGAVRLVAELEATGPLLSWLHLDVPGAWSTGTVSLAPGSMLVVYTDGLTEARPSGSTDELGVEGVLEALSGLPELTPQTLVDEALDVARRFSGGRARDDVTLVVLARSTTPAPSAPPAAPSAPGGSPLPAG
ncbi:SpoIIE family protein phosphatase [Paenibacillus sp. TRM 82003]|uniref:PP2C family protein-serine/threonine phosphatase n=1 Tax=Kineococcus sp. TRM81007 TaxID=2925831 RepID=UPI001F56183D|nr:SpoIIE family protein phosphatase [Kineococcus sp. TRM81007]MCI2239855.1 SpoIIE family protein phosphatase [Kineococcus sp. TRM81007]MCI3925841.1 SpoIIE family protein phosphatase [Paenibacillus sp. TRM 82003]